MHLSWNQSDADARRQLIAVPSVDDLPRRVVSITEELLSVMGIRGDVLCRDRRRDDPPHFWIEILAQESGGLLIGDRGGTLQALEHILRRILRPHVGEEIRIIADVNAYRARRMEVLRQLARSTARRVSHTRRAALLKPMSAADRRIIHLTLATEEGVVTESQGEEPHRQVVVRPRDPLA